MATITLTEFTDPNCTWSWGAEPLLRHVETLYGDQLTIRFVMGGLIEDFDEFHDAANNISEPHQVAPHWEAASGKHGMPVDATIWQEDPPRSTYPASIATKAAEFQDQRLGLRYLRRVREVAATERGNTAKSDVLTEIAAEVGLDVNAFREAIDSGRAESAFEEDLRISRQRGVRGFPTFQIEAHDEATIVGGYQSFDSLERALVEFAPDIERRALPSVEGFVTAYGYVATREVAEVYEWDTGKAEQVLRELASTDVVRAVDRGNGTFWMPNDETSIRRGTGELAQRGDFE